MSKYVKVIKEGLVLPARGVHKKTVFWLHGLGDSANGVLPMFDNNIWNPFDKYTKMILLNAKERKVTLNGGMM